MKSPFFAYIARMRYISRWALMRNTRTENVQEHSHMVAVLAHALAVIRNRRFGGSVDTGAVTLAALYHDASEIFTGDLPTPIKYYNNTLRDSYREVERIACDKLISLLPQELRADFAPALTEVSDEVHTLVKAADKLSAYIKCIDERKAGNIEFSRAEEQTLSALRELQLPEVDYFLENFMGSFHLTLDELQ